LGVHMRVPVHEAGSDHPAIGVDHLASPLANAADGCDAAVSHRDVGSVAGQARAIDHHAVLDHQVIRHRAFLPSNVAVSYVSSGGPGQPKIEDYVVGTTR